ncbi:MarR family EPS-associated transcriptional regulator [Solirhodobacter olei]|uniref:MarR family EPS-associated transcriptional regulator n=1 Tax=Solirhodobacter olei TaxID=2493082 RepID=UPI000FD73021|nr:MarR family EPS-associated transcriptional regulator [Solirhodobacter olei]
MSDPADDARFRVLRLLKEDPTLSQKELSEALGVSVGQVNYVLRALVDKGYVKLRNFRSSTNKPRYAYLLTPAGLAAKSAMTASFLRRKMVEYERLKVEIEAVMAEADEARLGSRE